MARFQDLPDGRPQYGIRLPAGEPAGDAAAHKSAAEGTGGQGAGPQDPAGQNGSAGGSTSTDASR